MKRKIPLLTQACPTWPSCDAYRRTRTSIRKIGHVGCRRPTSVTSQRYCFLRLSHKTHDATCLRLPGCIAATSPPSMSCRPYVSRRLCSTARQLHIALDTPALSHTHSNHWPKPQPRHNTRLLLTHVNSAWCLHEHPRADVLKG